MGRFSIAIVALALLLGGCTHSAGLVCGPQLKQYTVAEMQRASREYKKAKAEGMDALTKLADDYGIERDAIRACLKHLK